VSSRRHRPRAVLAADYGIRYIRNAYQGAVAFDDAEAACERGVGEHQADAISLRGLAGRGPGS
jgi:hypothetical protein